MWGVIDEHLDVRHEERAHARSAQLTARASFIALFGCGGDRDPFKRPRMARVAEELADLVEFTSDNRDPGSPMPLSRG